MKRCYALLLIFLLSIFYASSQTHFITAGQTQGMMVTDYVPDSVIYFTHTGYDHHLCQADINHDADYDFEIEYTQILGSGHQTFQFTIDGLFPQNVKFLSKQDSGTCSQLKLVAIFLNFGDTIYLNDNNWSYPKTTIYDASFYIGGGGCGYGSFIHGNTYLAGRLNVSNDTLLFYLHLTSDSISGHGYLLDYAIEGPDSTIIINSTNNLSPSILSISPNPFTSFINITSEKPFQFTVSDYLGRVVMQGVSDKTIATDALASGSYILTIKNEEMVSVRKMVKY